MGSAMSDAFQVSDRSSPSENHGCRCSEWRAVLAHSLGCGVDCNCLASLKLYREDMRSMAVPTQATRKSEKASSSFHLAIGLKHAAIVQVFLLISRAAASNNRPNRGRKNNRGPSEGQ